MNFIHSILPLIGISGRQIISSKLNGIRFRTQSSTRYRPADDVGYRLVDMNTILFGKVGRTYPVRYPRTIVVGGALTCTQNAIGRSPHVAPDNTLARFFPNDGIPKVVFQQKQIRRILTHGCIRRIDMAGHRQVIHLNRYRIAQSVGSRMTSFGKVNHHNGKCGLAIENRLGGSRAIDKRARRQFFPMIGVFARTAFGKNIQPSRITLTNNFGCRYLDAERTAGNGNIHIVFAHTTRNGIGGIQSYRGARIETVGIYRITQTVVTDAVAFPAIGIFARTADNLCPHTHLGLFAIGQVYHIGTRINHRGFKHLDLNRIVGFLRSGAELFSRGFHHIGIDTGIQTVDTQNLRGGIVQVHAVLIPLQAYGNAVVAQNGLELMFLL